MIHSGGGGATSLSSLLPLSPLSPFILVFPFFVFSFYLPLPLHLLPSLLCHHPLPLILFPYHSAPLSSPLPLFLFTPASSFPLHSLLFILFSFTFPSLFPLHPLPVHPSPTFLFPFSSPPSSPSILFQFILPLPSSSPSLPLLPFPLHPLSIHSPFPASSFFHPFILFCSIQQFPGNSELSQLTLISLFCYQIECLQAGIVCRPSVSLLACNSPHSGVPFSLVISAL